MRCTGMFCSFVLLITFAGCSKPKRNETATPATPDSSAQPVPSGASETSQAPAGDEKTAAVRTSMQNVEYHLTDRIIVHIHSLNGQLTPKPGKIPVFEDKNSFGLAVDSANITLSMASLTNDLNDFVFAKPDAPLKHLTASTQGDQLIMKGLLVSKGGIPFETSGTMSVTPEGMIRVHTTKVKALKLPVKGLMDMLDSIRRNC
jgi:hypothetical protein